MLILKGLPKVETICLLNSLQKNHCVRILLNIFQSHSLLLLEEKEKPFNEFVEQI